MKNKELEMKRNLVIFLFFILSVHLFPQSYKYAWITDMHIGAPNADSDLIKVVSDINQRHEIEFVIATGDITEKGRDEEFQQSKEILDKLEVPYYIIPGNHDTKWSESGSTTFEYLWGDTKFYFDYKGTTHIGLNSGIPWRGGGGHVSPEDLNWLNKTLERTTSEQEIIFYIHHPLDDDTDNWFKVTNIFRDKKIIAVLVGHGHANKLMEFNGIPAAMGRSTLSRPKFAGYTLIENKSDSLLFFEVNEETGPTFWGGITKQKNDIPIIDSTQFVTYSDKVKVEWEIDLTATLSASLLVTNDRLFAATKDGLVMCYDFSGKKIWEYLTSGTIFSRPVRDRDVLAVGTIEGDLITFNANNGDLIQILGINEPITSQLIAIDIEFGGRRTKGVIAGTASGKLLCYDMYSMQLIWQNDAAKGMIETLPLYLNNKIIYGSWDNYLHCVDARSGLLIWRWTENKNFYYSPAACMPVTDGKNIYVTTPDKYVSAIDALLGTTVWRKDTFNSWESIGISEDKQKLFVKSVLDNLFIASAKDGKLIKEVKIGYGLDTMPVSPIEWKENIIFGSKNGMMYLIKNKYEWESLFFMGTARVHTVQHVKDNLFAASNMDGKIILFRIDL